MNKNLKFVEMYRVKGVPPLGTDHEIGQVYTKDFEKLGIYGDRYFVFYNKGSDGTAYFEESEMKKAAQSGFDFFTNEEKFKRYLSEVEDVLNKDKEFVKKIKQIDVSTIPDTELINLNKERDDLDELTFTYYYAIQPQMLSVVEDKIKAALESKVEKEKAGDYLSKLTISEKNSLLSEEELEWFEIIKFGKEKNIQLNKETNIESEHSELFELLNKHLEKFETLAAGDGKWHVDISEMTSRYITDFQMTLDQISKRIVKIKNYTNDTLGEKEKIIKEINLEPEILQYCNVLSEIGHLRLIMRIEGWVPLFYFSNKLNGEINNRLGLPEEALGYTVKEELRAIFEGNWVVSREEILKRMSAGSYLYMIDDGKIIVFYGEEADKRFKELIPEEDLSSVIEVSGNTAMTGKVTGKVCLYKWGDDMDERLNFINENKILVAGQTRPQMMPLIRKASAIITDEGGVISHAAIVSRELGIPCIVGTKKSTQIFKDGDMVEVDADGGIAKKINVH